MQQPEVLVVVEIKLLDLVFNMVMVVVLMEQVLMREHNSHNLVQSL
jgi:hypothetical protein